MKQEQEQENKTVAPIVDAKTDAPQGIAAIRAEILALQSKGISRAVKRLSDGCAYTYRVNEAKGANLRDVARVLKHTIDNSDDTVTVRYTAAHVAAHFIRAVGITAPDFATLQKENDGATAPYFAAVVRHYAPKAALLAALKL
jgi:hypothetical protein